jgi:hypothetical protein
LANITGTIGSKFVATIDSGQILSAKLHIAGGDPGQDKILPFTDQTVSVNLAGGLPAGPSSIRLTVVFVPGDPNATIGVGTVISGTAAASNPPGIIFNDPTHPAQVITLIGA